MAELLLGRAADYPDRYDPGLLCPLPRIDKRRELGLGDELPFRGEDVWNAWELTWLDSRGKPSVATATLRFPVGSPNIVESKSMKLYLNSLAMTAFADDAEVARRIGADLGAAAGTRVGVQLLPPPAAAPPVPSALPGRCLDDQDVACEDRQVNPDRLRCGDGRVVEESFHTHLLRSICPVTGQPDIGSLAIRYRGPRIDPAGLLQYVVSYRTHGDFHEHCVERIFVDLQRRCSTEQLTVFARYTRRGGIDINPYRSDVEPQAVNPRVWRQ